MHGIRHTGAASLLKRLAAPFVSTKGDFSRHIADGRSDCCRGISLRKTYLEYTIRKTEVRPAPHALAASIETAPKTTAFSAVRRTSRTVRETRGIPGRKT